MSAARYNLDLERGVTFSLPVHWEDSAGSTVNLSSGYTARLELRDAEPESPGTVVLTLTNGSGITLAATNPNVTVALTATQTRALTAGRSYCYELRLYAGSTEYALLYGAATVREQVTAPS